MSILSLGQLVETQKLTKRPVLVRLDLNVPLHEGEISSEARIRAALPTIRALRNAGAIVGLASHLGRPKGKARPELSLEPVGARLSELLGTEVMLADDCVGDGVRWMVQNADEGAVILLENLRFYAEETRNEPSFATKLAQPFDYYVNDAFGVCHRSHASVTGCLKSFNTGCIAGGPLIQKEVRALGELLTADRQGFVALVGGAKVSDKIGVLSALLPRVETLCIGGAMAYTFLKAQGHDVGASRLEHDRVADAKALLDKAEFGGTKVMLPVDHRVSDRFEESAESSVVGQLKSGQMGLDIGPNTARAFAEVVEASKTIFWNGPMGVFEWDAYSHGTMAIAQAVADSSGFSVVGGGDSVAAIEKAEVIHDVSHVSTGGGASLEFIELEGKLPGLLALVG